MLTFYCHACLEDKPANEQSLDPRYCHGCCEFLLNEAKILPRGKRPSWIPTINREASPSEPEPLSLRAKQGVEQARGCNKISIGVLDRVGSKRGRRRISIPMELIAQITKEGITSCRGISQRLKSEYDIGCSFMTVARVIKGNRKQFGAI